MDALTRISRARAGLILSAPFFATLAMDMGAAEKPDIDTMATDGKSLFFNPDFVAECSDAELRGVIVHEVLHVAFRHHTRRGTRDPKLWNVAADYVINGEVIREGFTLPQGALIDPRFDGMTSEQVYTLLQSEADPNADPGDTPGQLGDVMDAADPSDPAAMKAADMDAQAKVLQAENAARMAGQSSALGQRLAGDIRKPVIDWRSVLRRFVDESSRVDYSWTRPNRRHIAQGLYLPGTVPDGMGRLAVVMDVSGSVEPAALGAFLGELQAAIDDAAPDAVDVIQCDRRITAHDTFAPGDDINVAFTGGGGTDMQPAIDRVAELGASACIVFTDCAFYRATEDKGTPTLWARWDASHAPPAWGELVDVA